MATYKFPQFNLEIIDPIINVEKVNDSITYHACSVDVVLTTNSAVFGVTFTGFTYDTTWDDQDIIDWVETIELPKYMV
jgi:hypothetical protein